MPSHVSLGTNDTARAAAFYDPVLATLGIRRLRERDGSLDHGASMMVFSLETPSVGKPVSVGNGVHVACSAECRAMTRIPQVNNDTGTTAPPAPVPRPIRGRGTPADARR